MNENRKLPICPICESIRVGNIGALWWCESCKYAFPEPDYNEIEVSQQINLEPADEN